tara:strand:- start:600 stop:1703 length:1104 start_codon:yes stop_codon:yes gene_type:complete
MITSIGLMSGTSCDGIDSSIIESDGEKKVNFIGDFFYPYSEQIKDRIRQLKDKINLIKDLETNKIQLKTLEKEITLFHAKCVNLLINETKLDSKKIELIGFHGQTIFHSFKDKKTLQLGDANLLSQLTNKNVIYNFREKDILNGGQGAPLTPIFHKVIKDKLISENPLVFINIGGIANITFIDGEKIFSFDSGPGNFLIDKFLQFKTKNKFQFDNGGKIAFRGAVDKNILQSYLEDPYFSINPPKSLDVNDFSLTPIRALNLENAIATLSEFTALTISNSLNFFLTRPKKIILSGGGRKNKFIHDSIEKLSNIPVVAIDDYKINGDFIESQAFAYLAIRSFLKKPISFPGTTGVREPITGGSLVEAK